MAGRLKGKKAQEPTPFNLFTVKYRMKLNRARRRMDAAHGRMVISQSSRDEAKRIRRFRIQKARRALNALQRKMRRITRLALGGK